MKKHDIDGTVVLLGTPAEEGGAGKVELLKLGGCEWFGLSFRIPVSHLVSHAGFGSRATCPFIAAVES